MKRYIAIVSKDKDSSFGLHFPDLPGCVAAGETEDEALANASVALRLWLGDGELPEPSTLANLRHRGDVRKDLAEGGVAVSVPVITAGRKQRLNIMLEPDIIEAADQAAAAAGVSRSQFIEHALEESLARDLGAMRVATRKQTRKRAGTPAK